MSVTKNFTKGIADEAIGKTKQAVGKALDRPDITAEGKVQEVKGDGEKYMARAEHALKN